MSKYPTLPTTAQLSSEDGIEKATVSTDTALTSSHRLLIRGLAGSGKTTLLQWIAVKAATRSFEGPLSDWNGLIPFYIPLHRYAQKDLPKPEKFIDFTAPMIADTMPRGWVHKMLDLGRAIVLVDGVDEIPASKREEVHTWLRNLVGTFEKVRVIVTSRPHAIEEGWMNHEAFSNAELQPMGLADIYSFIDRWHDAVRKELETDYEKAELGPLAEHLKGQVKRIRPIRTLATNPLLCAMLCALNRERRRHLPINRIELYEACCSLLLERREKESHIDLSEDYIAALSLNYSQKHRLLEDLAYEMIKANLSEIPRSQVDEGFARKLANMPQVLQDATGAEACKWFVQRSGILYEPLDGQIIFVHRTFQEFFAAQAAVNAKSIETLVENAHNDQWQEVIILAAGLARNREECEQLINGLIRRGDQEEEKARGYRLHLTAISCMETAIELGSEVKVEVDKRLGQLVPPKDMADAQALAAAGELAIKHLTNEGKFSATAAAACVRTLAIIGGEAALDVLEEYANDGREEVLAELLAAWDSFDQKTYAKRVLSRALEKRNSLYLERLSSLDGIQYLTSLTSLDLSYCNQVSDLSPLASLTQLTSLDLSYCDLVSDLSPLANLTQLTSLNLSAAPLSPSHSFSTSQVYDLTPLANLTQLTSLDLSYCGLVSDLTPLANLTQLTMLNLSGCHQVSDLSPLAELKSLRVLFLHRTHSQIAIPQSIKDKVADREHKERSGAHDTWAKLASQRIIMALDLFTPPSEVVQNANIMTYMKSKGFNNYEAFYQWSLANRLEFWDDMAKELHWYEPWQCTFEWTNKPFFKWFTGGKFNIVYNCLDRHMDTPTRSKVAYYWEGDDRASRTLTYEDLYVMTNRLAKGLQSLGVKRGDRVAIYMPMVPELAVAMLAIARLGAIHTVVFEGFGPSALRDRINDAQAKLVITADGSYRGGKLIEFKNLVDEVVAETSMVEKVIVVRRLDNDVSIQAGRDIYWDELVADIPEDTVVPCEPMDSEDILYILYMSGETAKPKGVVHVHGGYAVGVYSTTKLVFDIKPSDIFWCTPEIGGVTGHSYTVYGPLMNAATCILFEGIPTYPTPDRWWSIIEKYKVTIFHTVPTAIRHLMRLGEELPSKHDLTSLRLLGTEGELISPEVWMWYRQNIGRNELPIIDTWWQAETGMLMISPTPILPLKPGSVTRPLPTIDADVVDMNGVSVGSNKRGFLIIRHPWPAQMRTFYTDPDRYQTYWTTLEGVYSSGDSATIDKDGYFRLQGRIDDVIKVSGHRLGAIEIESSLLSHPAVAEVAAIGKPDEIKGEHIKVFVILRHGFKPSDKLAKELKLHIRETLGAIAVPDELQFVLSLPKTRSGKIMRRVIRAGELGEPTGDINTLDA